MRKTLAGWFVEEGTKAVSKAAGRLLDDPRGQEAVARAVGLAQKGLQAFGAVQERALHAAGLAARPDTEELRKQLARLKRKIRELDRRARGGGPGGGENR
jgi:cytosine/adenosine deaminase-related metal-dependent hydrolase